eukprot:TRINITY_DN5821_c0_g1_i1.p1 TRINITY_DN5821_c0_g1~~TRINITY_DN5821_c0_g1_i1.p1  ORF type:complete len:1262 (-),score=342.89 TRINITY_DN5821_c0_g1_i1:78-3863(-)
MNRLSVVASSSPNCFINLPRNVIQLIDLDNMFGRALVNLVWGSTGNRKMMLAWSGDTSASPDTVEISHSLLEQLGLEPYTQVYVYPVQNEGELPPQAEQVFLEPASEDDWEIVEMNAEYLESQLMNQLAVVAPGMVIPIWIRNTTTVLLKITSITPENVEMVRLGEGSEVVIAPKERKRGNARKDSIEAKPEEPQSSIIKHEVILRVQRIQTQNKKCSPAVLLSQQDMQRFGWNEDSMVDIISLEVTREKKGQEENGNNDDFQPKRAFCYVCASKEVSPGHVIIDHAVSTQIQSSVFSRTRLKIVDPKACIPADSLFLEPCSSTKFSSKRVLKSFGKWINAFSSEKASLPLINGTIVPLRRSETRRMKKRESSGFSEGEADTSDDEEEKNVGFDYFRLFCNAPEIVKYVKEGKEKEKKKNVPQVRVPRLEDVTGSLSPFAADWMGQNIFQSNPNPQNPDSNPEPPKKDIGAMVKTLLSSHETFYILKSTGSSPKKAKTETETDKKSKKSKIWSEGDLRNLVKILEAPILSWKTPQNNHATFPGDEVILDDIGGMEKAISMSKQALLPSLALKRSRVSPMGRLPQNNIIFHGKHGTGKSMLARGLCQYFGMFPGVHCYSIHVSCSELSVKRLETIRTSLDKVFQLAIKRQPSIIVLDDLDIITPVETPDMRGDKVRGRAITEKLLSHLQFLSQGQHAISVIMTAQGVTKLNPILTRPDITPVQIEILPPDQAERRQIFSKLLCVDENRNGGNFGGVDADVDLDHLSRICEGYVGVDLYQVVERAHHIASLRYLHALSAPPSRTSKTQTSESTFSERTSETSDITEKTEKSVEEFLSEFTEKSAKTTSEDGSVTPSQKGKEGHVAAAHNKKKSGRPHVVIHQEDLLEAHEGFTPLSLKGVPLFKSTVSWNDIGGLWEVKKALKETIEWPTRYSFLYKSSPLRNRSGLMLYGPPGCGKTQLACAVAKECGLNFITVKGPELLNKYIGASEEAVREKFVMAQMSKPCVLFFDEFDSIAPRRGHDNTGVTDRVVNQFLTALDGVESLDGVYVLAATSRPDLIDPALLRPGRLDKCLYLGIPTTEELADIFKSQTRNLTLDESVDFLEIAKNCENFTGADTQALIYNAQLESIHNKLDHTSGSSSKAENEEESLKFSVLKMNGEKISLTSEKKLAIEQRLKVMTKNVFESPETKQNFGVSENTKEKEKETKSACVVTRQHFMNALKNFTPSLPDKERLRYESIYQTFMASKGGDFADTSGPKKQTLA